MFGKCDRNKRKFKRRKSDRPKWSATLFFKMLKACRMAAKLDWHPHEVDDPGKCLTGGACPVCETLTLINEIVKETKHLAPRD